MKFTKTNKLYKIAGIRFSGLDKRVQSHLGDLVVPGSGQRFGNRRISPGHTVIVAYVENEWIYVDSWPLSLKELEEWYVFEFVDRIQIP